MQTRISQVFQFSSVQSLSHVRLFVTPWTAAHQVPPSFTVSWSVSSVAQSCPTLCDPMNCSMPGLPVHHRLMSIELVMSSNYLILFPPLLLLPSVFPSIRVFSDVSALHIRWPKYWSLSFSISPSSEYGMYIGRGILWEKSCVGQLWRLYFERNLGWEITTECWACNFTNLIVLLL